MNQGRGERKNTLCSGTGRQGKQRGGSKMGIGSKSRGFLPGTLGHLSVHCSVGAGEPPEASEQAVI